jgi:5-(carboxyamino)imidazole ribonucleotide mutase
MNNSQAQVLIVMGSSSDHEIMVNAKETLESFGISCEYRVASAHRAPDVVADLAKNAASRGVQVIIAGAGGAAHLPGVIAAHTALPVIGVPIPTNVAGGLDSLLSIVQMPGGIPVATVATGKGGAKNAGLLAVAILALANADLREKLHRFREEQTRKSLDVRLPV